MEQAEQRTVATRQRANYYGRTNKQQRRDEWTAWGDWPRTQKCGDTMINIVLEIWDLSHSNNTLLLQRIS